MKNIKHPIVEDDFVSDGNFSNDNSGVSTPEDSLTEEQLAIAWSEFEEELREMERENNY